MFIVLILFFLAGILLNGITTIPFSIVLIIVSAVVFRKSWVFFVAFGLGILLDLLEIRTPGYASLMLTIFVFVIWLYERKFETQTLTFVFFSSFLGSLFYLWFFGHQMVLLQSLVGAFLGVLLFKFLIRNFQFSIKSKFEN